MGLCTVGYSWFILKTEEEKKKNHNILSLINKAYALYQPSVDI